jgi:hypothetical protein
VVITSEAKERGETEKERKKKKERNDIITDSDKQR